MTARTLTDPFVDSLPTVPVDVAAFRAQNAGTLPAFAATLAACPPPPRPPPPPPPQAPEAGAAAAQPATGQPLQPPQRAPPPPPALDMALLNFSTLPSREAGLELAPEMIPGDVLLATVAAARSAKTCKRRKLDLMPSRAPEPHKPAGVVPVEADEVVLRIAFYNTRRASLIQELLVLGSQRLTELRDRLYCVKDRLWEETRHSAMFFIESCFYNDNRHPDAADYSTVVAEWLGQDGREEHFGPLSSRSPQSMDDTRWQDLTVRLNTPYLYCHQGNCEHYFLITDVRLLHPTDSLDRRDYPRALFQFRERRFKCHICDTFHAKYITYEDEEACEVPCRFCERCFQALHFDSDGKKRHRFNFVEYFHE